MRGVINDIRHAIRVLAKSPEYTITALIALALGIGANTALFSVVYGILLKPMPYANDNELLVLEQKYPNVNRENVPFSVKEIHDYRDQSQTLSQIEEYHTMSFILLNDKEPDTVNTGVVSAHFFDLLGIKPLLGRTFVSSDDQPGAPPVLVLSYGYWKSKHGGDPNIIGKQFRMNDKVHTVVGVLPSIPQYPNEDDVYMPTVACPFRSSQPALENRNFRMMSVFGRLKPDTPLTTAQQELSTIAGRIRTEYATDYPANRGYGASAFSLKDRLTTKIRPMLLILFGTAGFVLLIACANVANLALARMAKRNQEIAIRVALGASRGRLMQQMVTESLVLSLGGGALGLLLASTSLSLLVKFASQFSSRAREVAIDGWVLAFTIGICILTGLVFGAIPALSARINLISGLKEGGNAASAKTGVFTLRGGLVMAQVAVSFMLLIGAGLLLRSFMKLQSVDAGFAAADRILTFNVPLNFSRYKGNADFRRFFEQLTPKLESLPGVESVAVSGGPPLTGRPSQQEVKFEGRGEDGEKVLVDPNIASPDTFKLLGVPLVTGRYFMPADTAEAPGVVIINSTFARHHFPNQEPIGKRISIDGGATWKTIVGVISDIKAYSLQEQPVDMFYMPYSQAPNGVNVMMRVKGDPNAYISSAREAVYSIDPEQPINKIKTLDEIRGETLAMNRLTASLLGAFALLALVIASTGLSGVIAFLVNNRTREIGIRMALGADRTDVLSMILTQAGQLIGIGLIAGIVGALVGSRLLRSLLFNTAANDVGTFIGVAALFVLVALLASYLPARRATQVDPLVALRAE
jgi:putative ABC transport system permease protein